MTKARRAAALVVAALAVVVLPGCGASPIGEPPSAPTPSSPRPASTPAGSIRTHAARLPSSAPAATAVPSRLVISSAGLDIPVQPVGVAADGQMQLPPNPSTLGWYRFGPGPADTQGAIVLGGHVDSKRYGVGPLVRLRRVKPGELITLYSSDGRTTQYQIRSAQDIAKKKLPTDQLFTREGPRTLRVITCGGPYDHNGGGYRDNLVVTAVPA